MSYKIQNGKLVRRTAAEQADLDRRKAAYYAEEAAAAPNSRVPKSKEKFVIVTLSQLDRLLVGAPTVSQMVIFMILLFENFRHRGRPFIMPSEAFAKLGGYNLRTQQRALFRLEKCGLISVRRVHRGSPEITVL